MLSRTTKVHNVRTHVGTSAVHENEVTSRHPESRAQGYLGKKAFGAAACPGVGNPGPC